MNRALTNLDSLKQRLDGYRPFPAPVIEELKKLYDVRFTYNSNAIEGNTLTQSETELVLEYGLTIGGKTLIEHLEVIGHKEAIDYIEQLSQSNEIFNEKEIKDIHNIVLRGISQHEAGLYRTLDVQAAGTEHVYPSHLKIQELISDYIGWLNSPDAKTLHPVEYAAEAHYRFVSIHPFRDGNGRVGRLLMNLILLKREYPIAVITNARRKEYIDSLIHAQNHNDNVSMLVNLLIDAVTDSMNEYLKVLSTAGKTS